LPKRLALPALLVLMALLSVAYASTTLIIPYTDFNSTARKDYPTQFTESQWTISLKCSLTFANTTEYAQIFITNSSAFGYYGINVNIALDENGYSYDFYCPNKVDPGPTDWVNIGMIRNVPSTKTLKISLDKEGYLTVSDGIKTYISGFKVTPYVASFISVKGSSNNICSSGDVEIKIDKYTPTPTQIILQWIPLVICFAMLGVAIGMIKKIT